MTRAPQRQLGPVLVGQSEPAIQWRDYAWIEPGMLWMRHEEARREMQGNTCLTYCPLGLYFAAMDELWPRLPRSERQAKLAWERSEAFTRDSDWPGWPGWVKYIGPRPQPAGRGV